MAPQLPQAVLRIRPRDPLWISGKLSVIQILQAQNSPAEACLVWEKVRAGIPKCSFVLFSKLIDLKGKVTELLHPLGHAKARSQALHPGLLGLLRG